MQALNVQFMSLESASKAKKTVRADEALSSKNTTESKKTSFKSILESLGNGNKKVSDVANKETSTSVQDSEKQAKEGVALQSEESPSQEKVADKDKMVSSKSEDVSDLKENFIAKTSKKLLAKEENVPEIDVVFDMTSMTINDGLVENQAIFNIQDSAINLSDNAIDLSENNQIAQETLELSNASMEELAITQDNNILQDNIAVLKNAYKDSIIQEDESSHINEETFTQVLSAESNSSVEVTAENALMQENIASLDVNKDANYIEESSNKENKPLISVVDLRTENVEESVNPQVLNEVKDEVKTTEVKNSSEQVAQELSLNTNNILTQDNILSSNDQTASATGSNFQQMLTEQIQNNAPEFVKAGGIVLRDNNEGSINLIMKPENLGNVKINLQVSDKVIAGQITVHSKEAYDAFKQSLDTLKQAFEQSGFDSANLSLALADSSNSGFTGHGQPQQSSEPFMANKAYSGFVQETSGSTVEQEGSVAFESDGYQIDVVA